MCNHGGFHAPLLIDDRPRFLSFMNGGGGHVTAGGAICMQLLTKYVCTQARHMSLSKLTTLVPAGHLYSRSKQYWS